jgi:hypothetical protein
LRLRFLLLVHHRADRQTSQRQHDHQRLIRRDLVRIHACIIHGSDQADLRDHQSRRDAFEAEPHRHPHNRQEEEVELLDAECVRKPEDRRKRECENDDDCGELERGHQDATPRRDDEEEWGQDRDADHVTDPELRGGHEELAARHEPEGSQQADIRHCDDTGAD